MRFVAVVVCAFAVGCSGLTSDQRIVRDAIVKDHGADPVSFIKWWPSVSAETANFAALFAEAKTERDKDAAAGLNRGGATSELLETLVAESKPTALVRVQYRAPNKRGENELTDLVYYIKGSEVAFAFPPTSDSPNFSAWSRRLFP